MRPESVPARPECPEPDRWSAPDVWASESAVSQFLGHLVSLIKPDFVLETGAYLGYTAEQIGLALRAEGRGFGVSLDTNGDRVEQAKRRAYALPVEVVTVSSMDYVPPQPIDLLFVDSDFQIRMAEVRRFQPYASPRCVVVLHDCAVPRTYPGVPQMLQDMDDVVNDGVVQPWVHFPTPRGLSITRYR